MKAGPRGEGRADRSAEPSRNGVSTLSGWTRFSHHRGACAGVAMLMALTGAAGLLLPWSLEGFDVQSLAGGVRQGPSLHAPPMEWDGEVGSSGRQHAPTSKLDSWMRGAASWFGRDDLGRSLLYRCALGLCVSAVVAAGAAATALVLGVAWGAAAGLIGGRTDTVLMRIVDVLYGLPYILMVILMKVALTQPLTSLLGRARYADLAILFLAIGSVSWLTMARVVRGLVRSLAREGYVEASRAMGGGTMWIFRRHLIPNVVGPVVAYASLVVPSAMLQEAFLSFLGIGVQPPLPSLGRLAADGIAAINPFVDFWWMLAFPCGLLALMLLALSIVGEALREALDPRAMQNMLG